MSIAKEEVLKMLDRTHDGFTKEYIIENMLTDSQFKKLGNKYTLKEVLALAKKRLENSKNDNIAKKAIKDNPYLFAMHPTKVEEVLGITKAERKRWQEEGKLKIVYHNTFSKYGRIFDVPMFNFIDIYKISDKNIEKWRTEHKQKVATRRSKGAKAAAKTRIENLTLVEQYKENYAKIYNEWLNESEKLAATMNLANWTMWISRLAKSFQIKAYNAIKKVDEYNAKKDMCYSLKEEAITLLLNAKDFTDVSMYSRGNSDKVYVNNLCVCHYQNWCNMRSYNYFSFGEYVQLNIESIKRCEHCKKDIQKHYYTLYYLHIADIKTCTNFSFHIPYPIGKSYLPNIKDLPKVKHQEQEGVFRFGRTLVDEECIVYTEKRILNEFSKAVNAFKMVCNIKDKEK